MQVTNAFWQCKDKILPCFKPRKRQNTSLSSHVTPEVSDVWPWGSATDGRVLPWLHELQSWNKRWLHKLRSWQKRCMHSAFKLNLFSMLKHMGVHGRRAQACQETPRQACKCRSARLQLERSPVTWMLPGLWVESTRVQHKSASVCRCHQLEWSRARTSASGCRCSRLKWWQESNWSCRPPYKKKKITLCCCCCLLLLLLLACSFCCCCCTPVTGVRCTASAAGQLHFLKK